MWRKSVLTLFFDVVGLNSWSGEMEIVGFESHDNGLSMESLASWFYIEKLLAVCRYVKGCLFLHSLLVDVSKKISRSLQNW